MHPDRLLLRDCYLSDLDFALFMVALARRTQVRELRERALAFVRDTLRAVDIMVHGSVHRGVRQGGREAQAGDAAFLEKELQQLREALLEE